MAFQGVSLSLPDSSLFKFPPGTGAGFVPPPPPGTTSFAPPIAIPDHVYQAVLDPKVPITIAAVYAVTAKALNIYNKSTGKKPWAISKTLAFRWFVIAHNIFLAVYSAWTWWGMFNALRRTVVSPMGPHGFAATMDSMCQINGPKGFGNSVFWDEESSKWMTLSDGVLTESAAPSQFEAGRMWNEGLAFYGWLFYLSKFYEVFDTLIILAKGKLSSTLQTYHHAGAMMCMWAGMRYMSVPIWIFVFFNSFIHAIMYTYYSVTAFKIRVPMFIKRSLTSMQITQFLVGGSGAMIHSFISYNIPVGAGSRTAEAASSASAVANSSAATGSVIGSVKGAFEHKTMPCITSSGTTFAIWLNVFYLTPLTYLFVAFFIESYLRRSNAASSKSNGSKDSNIAAIGEKAAWEAADGVKREVYGESKESVKKSNGRVLRSRQ